MNDTVRTSDDAPTLDVDQHILQIIERGRDALVAETTEIVFASGKVQLDRASVEQLLRANLAILEETLQGTSTAVRRLYLDATLPEVARSGTSPWRNVLHDGLPCWGLIVGLVAIQASEAQRGAVVLRLSRVMGTWWAEVWDAMGPVYRATGQL